MQFIFIFTYDISFDIDKLLNYKKDYKNIENLVITDIIVLVNNNSIEN